MLFWTASRIFCSREEIALGNATVISIPFLFTEPHSTVILHPSVVAFPRPCPVMLSMNLYWLSVLALLHIIPQTQGDP